MLAVVCRVLVRTEVCGEVCYVLLNWVPDVFHLVSPMES